MCRLGSWRRDVKRAERAGGISDRRREVNISARLATSRLFCFETREAISAQAGTPRVLPPRRISVMEVEVRRGSRWGRASSAVESLRDWFSREKIVGLDCGEGDNIVQSEYLSKGKGVNRIARVLCNTVGKTFNSDDAGS